MTCPKCAAPYVTWLSHGSGWHWKCNHCGKSERPCCAGQVDAKMEPECLSHLRRTARNNEIRIPCEEDRSKLAIKLLKSIATPGAFLNWALNDATDDEMAVALECIGFEGPYVVNDQN